MTVPQNDISILPENRPLFRKDRRTYPRPCAVSRTRGTASKRRCSERSSKCVSTTSDHGNFGGPTPLTDRIYSVVDTLSQAIPQRSCIRNPLRFCFWIYGHSQYLYVIICTMGRTGTGMLPVDRIKMPPMREYSPGMTILDHSDL